MFYRIELDTEKSELRLIGKSEEPIEPKKNELILKSNESEEKLISRLSSSKSECNGS